MHTSSLQKRERSRKQRRERLKEIAAVVVGCVVDAVAVGACVAKKLGRKNFSNFEIGTDESLLGEDLVKLDPFFNVQQWICILFHHHRFEEGHK